MECGHEKTCIVPIIEGEMKKVWADITDVAGKTVQRYLQKIYYNNEPDRDFLDGKIIYIVLIIELLCKIFYM